MVELGGKFDTNKPYSKQKIKSVTINESTDGAAVKITFKKLKGLNIDNFTNPSINVYDDIAMAGNDEITGIDAYCALPQLQGGPGNDTIFIEKANQAIGGQGADDFIFRKDTENAYILDYNPDEGDKITVMDDSAENYRIETIFGETNVLNTSTGMNLLTINPFNSIDSKSIILGDSPS